jgi:hypothetical protein
MSVLICTRSYEDALTIDADDHAPSYDAASCSDNSLSCDCCIDLVKPLPLPDLLKVLKSVHNEQPAYDIYEANCVWYVDQVMQRLQEAGLYPKQGLERLQSDVRVLVSTRLPGKALSSALDLLKSKCKT